LPATQKTFGGSGEVDAMDGDDGKEDGEQPDLDTAKFHAKGGVDTSMLHDPSLLKARILKVRIVGGSVQ
jgi:hypothetical protein